MLNTAVLRACTRAVAVASHARAVTFDALLGSEGRRKELKLKLGVSEDRE